MIESITHFNSLAAMLSALPDEQACRKYLELQRWGNTPVCPHCGSVDAKHYVLTTKGEHRGMYKCRSCRQRFTATIGSIFEATRVPLRKWFIALYLFGAHRKGISSHQLGRDLGVTQKTAWFMLQRMRKVFADPAPERLEGAVSMDETFIGGKNKNRHAKKKFKNSQGGNSPDKTIVIGAMDDTGHVRTKIISDRSTHTLYWSVRQMVKPGSVLITDELAAYGLVDDEYFHVRVVHNEGEYVRAGLSPNNLEGFWSHIKRGIIGIYHKASQKHLKRYCAEFEFRQNNRKLPDYQRFDLALRLSAFKRLRYKELIANTG